LNKSRQSVSETSDECNDGPTTLLCGDAGGAALSGNLVFSMNGVPVCSRSAYAAPTWPQPAAAQQILGKAPLGWLADTMTGSLGNSLADIWKKLSTALSKTLLSSINQRRFGASAMTAQAALWGSVFTLSEVFLLLVFAFVAGLDLAT
jgi:hypothetical protein